MNLDRRPDRLERFRARFPASWPFQTPERVQALDGLKVPPPDDWPQQPGAWGCLRTHLQLWERALNNNESIFIFEDDCVFSEDFAARVGPFFAHLPADWQMVYLGGLHRAPKSHPPVKVNDHVHLGRAITTTYAYGIHRDFLPTLYKAALGMPPHHIDQTLARLMAANTWRVYCPVPWLVGMDEGRSDIADRYYAKPHFWQYTPKAADDPIHIVSLISRQRYRGGQWQEVDIGTYAGPQLVSSVPGWFTSECAAVYRRECARFDPCRLVEVGCWKGRSISFLADMIRSGQVLATCVDPWTGNSDPKDPTHGQDVYADFQGNMERLGLWGHPALHVMREPSVTAAARFGAESLDLVMIDADHEYTHVLADLVAWWPKVREGGVLMGHDYGAACSCPGVVQAVNEFAAGVGVSVESAADMWILRKKG